MAPSSAGSKGACSVSVPIAAWKARQARKALSRRKTDRSHGAEFGESVDGAIGQSFPPQPPTSGPGSSTDSFTPGQLQHIKALLADVFPRTPPQRQGHQHQFPPLQQPLVERGAPRDPAGPTTTLHKALGASLSGDRIKPGEDNGNNSFPDAQDLVPAGGARGLLQARKKLAAVMGANFEENVAGVSGQPCPPQPPTNGPGSPTGSFTPGPLQQIKALLADALSSNAMVISG